MSGKLTGGWGFITNSTKWHYYADGGVSLCRRFMKFSTHDLEDSGDNSPDNCAECKKRIVKFRAKIQEANRGE